MPVKSLYRKLPFRSHLAFTLRRLWQGPDHLLMSETIFTHETYKRFYYHDLQALVIRRTRHFIWWTILWAMVVGFFGLLAWLNSEPPYISAGFAVVLFIGFVLNLILGPTCEIYLQTAVQLQKITNACRQRAAFKLADRIKVLVEQRQGTMDATAVQSAQAAMRASDSRRKPQPPSAGAQNQSTRAPAVYSPTAHRGLFALLLLTGGLKLMQLRLASPALFLVDLLLLITMLIGVIWVLIQFQVHTKNSPLSVVTWSVLGALVLQGISVYIFYVAASFRHPELAYSQLALFREFVVLQSSGESVAHVAGIAFAAIDLLLGASGWWASLAFNPKSSTRLTS